MKKYILLILLFVSIIGLSACSNNSNTDSNTNNSNTSNSNTQTEQSPIGDWKYKGSIDSKNYEIELDLDSNGEFDYTVDEESAEETEDSEAEGTYVIEGNKIKLSIMTVQNSSSYFTGKVVQNGQIDLEYTLSENGDTLTLENAPDSIAVLPDKIEMSRS